MVDEPSLSVEIGLSNAHGLRLRNPVMTAAGTFGYGVEYARLVEVDRLGAVVTSAITRSPVSGYPGPRVVETPAGLLSAVGWQNVGLDACIRDFAPVWRRWSVPVIANVAGFSVHDFIAVVETLAETPGVSAIELDLECPDLARSGTSFGGQVDLARGLAGAVRGVCDVPLIAKLSPTAANIVEIAEAVHGAGVDALSVINAVPGMVVDTRSRRPYLGNRTGGLSGPAIRPIGVRAVYEIARALPGVPIIGVGGVATAEDALQYIMVGARAVQIGTAAFVNPRAAFHIIEGLAEFLRHEGVADINDLVGVAQ